MPELTEDMARQKAEAAAAARRLDGLLQKSFDAIRGKVLPDGEGFWKGRALVSLKLAFRPKRQERRGGATSSCSTEETVVQPNSGSRMSSAAASTEEGKKDNLLRCPEGMARVEGTRCGGVRESC